MSYLVSKSKQLVPLIKKAFSENLETTNNLDLLSGYIWKYEGVDETMTFEDFFVGLLDGRFSNQKTIAKIQKRVKWEISKQNEQL
jgi:hypothetical protein